MDTMMPPGGPGMGPGGPPMPPLGGGGGPTSPPGMGPAMADAYRMPESFIAELQSHNVTPEQWNALSDEQMWNVMSNVTSQPPPSGGAGPMAGGPENIPPAGGPPSGPPGMVGPYVGS